MDLFTKLNTTISANELKLSCFTRMKDAPKSEAWDFIRQLYASSKLEYRLFGTILNGVFTGGKVAFLISERTMQGYLKDDPNAKRQSINIDELKRFTAQFIEAEWIRKMREHSFTGGKRRAAAYELVEADLLGLLTGAFGQGHLDNQRKRFYSQYGSEGGDLLTDAAPGEVLCVGSMRGSYASSLCVVSGTGIGTEVDVDSDVENEVGDDVGVDHGTLKGANAERQRSGSLSLNTGDGEAEREQQRLTKAVESVLWDHSLADDLDEEADEEEIERWTIRYVYPAAEALVSLVNEAGQKALTPQALDQLFKDHDLGVPGETMAAVTAAFNDVYKRGVPTLLAGKEGAIKQPVPAAEDPAEDFDDSHVST